VFKPIAHQWLTAGSPASNRLKRALAVEVLRHALVAQNPAPGLVHHPGRGSQCCSVDYQTFLRTRGIVISMSGRGNCYEASMAEAFLKTI
jgi:transposase InsO family protein